MQKKARNVQQVAFNERERDSPRLDLTVMRLNTSSQQRPACTFPCRYYNRSCPIHPVKHKSRTGKKSTRESEKEAAFQWTDLMRLLNCPHQVTTGLQSGKDCMLNGAKCTWLCTGPCLEQQMPLSVCATFPRECSDCFHMGIIQPPQVVIYNHRE